MRIVDIHEPDTIAKPLIKAGWDREHLTVADYMFTTYEEKSVGVERKEASDLLNSLASGRLAQQLQNLINTYDYPFLLLEGRFGQSLNPSSSHSHISLSGGETKWTVEAVRNYLLTWQLKGIIKFNTSSIDDTINRLLELVVYFSKPLHLGGLNKRVLGDERLMAFPSCIPIKQREELLKYHGKIANLMWYDIDEFMKFNGIGRTRAEAIYNFYHKENNK